MTLTRQEIIICIEACAAYRADDLSDWEDYQGHT
jgi:hypothetical protein